jgi:Zn-dependent protease
MGASIHLLSVRGIDIRMHITFPLILIWGALQFGLFSDRGLSGAIFGVVVTLLLFIIVLLHELGHSFAAQYYGVEVKQIVLLPIGGVAQLASIPEKPSQEFVIAIAGPLVNFILAILMLIFGLLAGFRVSLAGAADIFRTMEALGADALFNYLFLTWRFLTCCRPSPWMEAEF